MAIIKSNSNFPPWAAFFLYDFNFCFVRYKKADLERFDNFLKDVKSGSHHSAAWSGLQF
jgi:hypothetical protein